MKKLLTACAACVLAGMVSAQVESVNIVGYQTLTLPAGYKATTATFVPVGSDGTTLRLGDVIPKNFSGDNGDTVQFLNLNGNGTAVTTATYYDGYGWCDFNNTEIMLDDMTIPAGTGMFVYASQSGAELLVAGQVALDALGLNVATGYTIVGNSSPVAITLGDITPSNFSGDFGDTAQFLNQSGNGTVATTATYYDGYGWCDFNNTETILDSTVLNPGDSFFVYASQSNVSFAFPAVL